MLAESDELHDRLVANVEHFRTKMMAAGFDIKLHAVGHLRRYALTTPSCRRTSRRACRTRVIFVTGFYYPVVPKGQARIRVQVSAGHTTEQLDRCVEAFVKIGKELGVLK